VNIKRKIAGGGLDVLSNAELQKLNTRLNLENSYSKAIADKGMHQKVKKGLDLGRTVNDAINFVTSPAGQLVVATAKGQNKGKTKLQALMDAKAAANPKKDKKKGN
jgi:capsular polysaccharide biosynthesis protein